MDKLFDYAGEWVEHHHWSKSTTDTYHSIVTRFGRTYYAANCNMSAAWNQFIAGRKRVKSSIKDPNKFRYEMERVVNHYLGWMKVRHYDVWSAAMCQPDTAQSSVTSKVKDIEFDDLLAWLDDMCLKLRSLRSEAVEDIVKFATTPTCKEFTDAVECIQNYDTALKRYESIVALVELYKEA